MKKIYALIIFTLTLTTRAALAQTDTLSLNLSQAESLFLKNNFDLLASNYEIDRAKAEIITAKLFENPTLEYENLFYNHETKKFLQTSYAHGQYAGSISQLFKLAGKRNKNIKLAQTGVKLAEYEYLDLLRTLKFELANTFYKTYFAAQSVKVYQEQIHSTDQLLKAYDLQLKMGNVATKDVIRIKSLLINLKAEQAGLLNELEDNYKDLKLLCGINAGTSISLELDQATPLSPDKIPYSMLLDSARANRADLKLAKTDLLYNESNLKLQKAMAIPDIEIGLSYDLKGNYPEKYTGLGLKIPIPLFSRNQGEIKKAHIGIAAADLNIKKQEALLENEVFNSYKTALRNEKLYAEIDPVFSTDFNTLISSLIKNFKARNISLIEFLDLYDAYKENTLQLNKLQFERMSTRAELNYVTGSNIFK
ncbi:MULTISPECIES: TolC family protein [unclassified Pedobacter]|uniref:TolC family protein n=1 Tax=unclassified Pedobacter TaxID=2628915 RepID=UPI0014205E6F|nr:MULTISPECIES: TolC family protein [unclassified Pedobacter]NII82005.1 cobalt-zinc-cadmium efflux system outer membrane protein [Pedobacter sp. SG908]NMN36009.1 cobalt-zinc-cadmium efflux system outer membrane protein [Pedobacter sp. SG918]